MHFVCLGKFLYAVVPSTNMYYRRLLGASSCTAWYWQRCWSMGGEERRSTKETAGVYIETGVGWAMCALMEQHQVQQQPETPHIYTHYTAQREGLASLSR